MQPHHLVAIINWIFIIGVAIPVFRDLLRPRIGEAAGYGMGMALLYGILIVLGVMALLNALPYKGTKYAASVIMLVLLGLYIKIRMR